MTTLRAFDLLPIYKALIPTLKLAEELTPEQVGCFLELFINEYYYYSQDENGLSLHKIDELANYIKKRRLECPWERSS